MQTYLEQAAKEIASQMTYIEGGVFLMGSNEYEEDEQPAHSVFLDSFYMSKFQITQKQWINVMGGNPSEYKSDSLLHPVENVSWVDVKLFIERLNTFTKLKYRFPTEAEWEYAAKGGQQTKEFKFAGSNDINEIAWYLSNSNRKTHPVGTKKANELGLYDMSGAVREWCSDWYDENYYSISPLQNPKGPDEGVYKVLRGGSFDSSSKYCTSTNRDYAEPTDRFNNLGLRLAFSGTKL